ncbi:CAP family protein [Streptomyces sp. B27]|uniref:CAP family protein n=1 Tax=Streptomyces TaxID=1883 RepID=UPI000FD7A3D6|nr:CAP family protein [Streptomyces sp. B27]
MSEGSSRRRWARTAAVGAAVAVLVATGPVGMAWARAPFPLVMDNAFQHDCLQAHNTYRAQHGVPALTINPDAVAYAKQRAQELSRHDGLSGWRRADSGFGENLIWSGSPAGHMPSCADAVRFWYQESTDFDYDYNRPDWHSTGRFTQVVWKSTTSLGCARVAGRDSQLYETYIVCNYTPPGNNVVEFKENVLPPL